MQHCVPMQAVFQVKGTRVPACALWASPMPRLHTHVCAASTSCCIAHICNASVCAYLRPLLPTCRRYGISTEALSVRLDSQLVAPVVGVLRPNDVELSPATRQVRTCAMLIFTRHCALSSTMWGHAIMHAVYVYVFAPT